MDAASLRRAASAVLMGIGGLLWLAAILFMAQTAQNSEQFGRLHPWILMVNVAGLVVLLVLLGAKLTQLVRDWRGHVIGSRIKARMVWIFGVLATLPILLVYFFAVQFLNRGIDSWFNVEIRRSLDDALVLSRSALEVRMREHLADTQLVADELAASGGAYPGLLETLRQQVGALELTIATESGSLIAVSKGLSSDLVPEELPDELLLQIRQGRPFVSLEPQVNGGYLVRTAVQLGPTVPGRERLLVQAVYPVAERLGALADTVQAAYQQYGEKDYLRTAAQGELHPDADGRAAAVAARGLVRRDFHGPAAGATDPGPRQGDTRRRAGRPRYAPADDVARRNGLSRALVQRHDQAPASRARRPAARAAGRRDRACQPGDHPRAALDRRRVARAGPACAHRQSRREHDPGRRSRDACRAAARLAWSAGKPAGPVQRIGARTPRRRRRRVARAVDARVGVGSARADVRLHAAARRGRCTRRVSCSSSTTSP